MQRTPARAAPLSPEQRKASIVDAATPLVIREGRDVTTRQIAEAAGVAEGTLFRVFADKESIIDAVFRAYLDPTRVADEIRDIGSGADLATTLTRLLEILSKRMGDIMALARALRNPERMHHRVPVELNQLIADALRPFAAELAWTPEEAARWVRQIAIARVVVAHNTQGGPASEFTTAEQVRFLVGGLSRTTHGAA